MNDGCIHLRLLVFKPINSYSLLHPQNYSYTYPLMFVYKPINIHTNSSIPPSSGGGFKSRREVVKPPFQEGRVEAVNPMQGMFDFFSGGSVYKKAHPMDRAGGMSGQIS